MGFSQAGCLCLEGERIRNNLIPNEDCAKCLVAEERSSFAVILHTLLFNIGQGGKTEKGKVKDEAPVLT